MNFDLVNANLANVVDLVNVRLVNINLVDIDLGNDD